MSLTKSSKVAAWVVILCMIFTYIPMLQPVFAETGAQDYIVKEGRNQKVVTLPIVDEGFDSEKQGVQKSLNGVSMLGLSSTELSSFSGNETNTSVSHEVYFNGDTYNFTLSNTGYSEFPLLREVPVEFEIEATNTVAESVYDNPYYYDFSEVHFKAYLKKDGQEYIAEQDVEKLVVYPTSYGVELLAIFPADIEEGIYELSVEGYDRTESELFRLGPVEVELSCTIGYSIGGAFLRDENGEKINDTTYLPNTLRNIYVDIYNVNVEQDSLSWIRLVDDEGNIVFTSNEEVSTTSINTNSIRTTLYRCGEIAEGKDYTLKLQTAEQTGNVANVRFTSDPIIESVWASDYIKAGDREFNVEVNGYLKNSDLLSIEVIDKNMSVVATCSDVKYDYITESFRSQLVYSMKVLGITHLSSNNKKGKSNGCRMGKLL